MIHLMIVDDEERARTGIRSLIDWERHQVAIVAEARDGLEALELLKIHRVDILLTDIRMPEMDGLALIAAVKETYPRIKSIIMSGYNEFTYAQKALTLGASDYLLKPSRRQEILDTVLHLIEDIEKERRHDRNLERLKQGFRESLPLLKEKTLGRLVAAEMPPYDKLLENLQLSGLQFPSAFFGVLVVQIDNFTALQKQYGSFDLELLKYGLKNISEETIATPLHGAAFEYHDDILVIWNADAPMEAADLLPYAESLRKNASEFLSLSVSIGIGSTGRHIRHARPSYTAAANALDAKYYMGPGKIVDYTEAADEEWMNAAYPIQLERAVIQAILSGESEQLQEKLELFRNALKPESTPKDLLLKYCFTLYFALYRLCIDKDIEVSDIFGEELQEMTAKLAKSNIGSIFAELLDTAASIGEKLNAKKHNHKLFESILEYVRNNYDKDISRESVAGEVYITPGYLSLLFKQQLKTGFLDYLHKIRIEHACLLLKDNSKRIGDIALKVGYNDEKYFFQVFKKYTGMTPNQYRNTI
ncbi:response regulator [Cohnella sp. CFH 77786]|uniref:response regulator n=1 Tax=Cohnella sp. CFH 77786 TaxID=2662265 RepID=UPI001C60B340|nr:response regulator [Cohnella sp. CFH 77786]